MREIHARFVVSLTVSDAPCGARCRARNEQPRAEQASNPGEGDHQAIGRGVPSAKAPTSAEPMMPLPYWIAPTRAETAPARSEIPEGRRRRALWVRSLPMTMTRNLC